MHPSRSVTLTVYLQRTYTRMNGHWISRQALLDRRQPGCSTSQGMPFPAGRRRSDRPPGWGPYRAGAVRRVAAGGARTASGGSMMFCRVWIRSQSPSLAIRSETASMVSRLSTGTVERRYGVVRPASASGTGCGAAGRRRARAAGAGPPRSRRSCRRTRPPRCPPSKAMMCVAMRSRNQRSWLTTTRHPANSTSASSSARRVSTSRSLVGSSSSSRLAPPRRSFARCTRLRSPPDSVPTLRCWSLPRKLNHET